MCDSNCVGCLGTSNNCTSQDGCKVNYFYNNATNSCVLICPDGTYADVLTKFCQSCTDGCAICSGTGLSKCTVCQMDSTTNITYFKMINKNQCSATCNPGQYGDSDYFLCFPCNNVCATCVNSTNCTTCQSLNGIAYYFSDNICTAICPSGNFGNLTGLICSPCEKGCLNCFGGTLDQCNNCTSYNGTSYFLISGTSTCNISCPNGQYSNDTDYTCRLCQVSCVTCVNSSSTCLSCGFSEFGYNLYLANNSCVASCPVGYWGNATLFTCDKCSPGCTACTSLSDCSVCGNVTINSTAADVYYKDIYSSVCNLTCPDGQFISSTKQNVCVLCSSQCVTCFGIASNCTSSTCLANYFFLNGSCLSVCPDNYYPNSTVWQCQQCSSGCQSCFGSGLTQCTKCNLFNSTTQYYLEIGGNTCGPTCNLGEFPSPLTKLCTFCNAACSNCSSLTICSSCQSVNGIAYFLNATTCTALCPSTQFGNTTSFICQSCADGCKTCFGGSLT